MTTRPPLSAPPAGRRILLIPLLGSALLLGACASLAPEPLTPAEIGDNVRADRLAAHQGVEPLTHDLTLEEAIARAIKYNAERRARMMEEAVASGTFQVSRFDMLPDLVAGAGYRNRDRDLLTLSRDLSTGRVIGGQTISSGRSAATADLTFSWSLLDFGQSYYAARQNADRMLVAGERRRKALHTLVQDVRTAFWRAAAAQKLGNVLQQATAEAEEALKDSQRAEKDGLRSPVEPLRYQLQVMENLRLLEGIEQELSTARIELASLANLPLTQNFRVVEPEGGINTAWLDLPIEKLEEHALVQNAELREGMYNARIARAETRRVLLKLFPGLSFNYGVRHSTDSFLINQTWNETGAQLSLNLLGLLSAPAAKELADAGVALADQQRMATQMAVLAQLHIARLLYGNAARQFERADALATVNGRITEHVTNQANASKLSRQERVAQQTSGILSLLRRYQALANAQAAASRLQATLGLEPKLDVDANVPLAALSSSVKQSLATWSTGKLPEAPAAGAGAAR
ncbi:MAG TPA: TolC family protein [Ramlibacter sp.]|nr:TolC family protein [Ramlibacter sp.]